MYASLIGLIIIIVMICTIIIVFMFKIDNYKTIDSNYNHKKCMKCIRKNNKDGVIRDCAECGNENFDTGCIPALLQKGTPTNCVSKDLSPEEAFWACKSVSSPQQQCSLIQNNSKSMLPFMKDECGNDHYCGYAEVNSCSYNQCYLDDYNPHESLTNCQCQPVPSEHLPAGIGRECQYKNCVDYTTKAPFTPPIMSFKVA
jgi:hypothetical protein